MTHCLIHSKSSLFWGVFSLTPHTHILSLLDFEALFSRGVSKNIPLRSRASQSSLSHGSVLSVQKDIKPGAKPGATHDPTAQAVLGIVPPWGDLAWLGQGDCGWGQVQLSELYLDLDSITMNALLLQSARTHSLLQGSSSIKKFKRCFL